VNPSLLRVIGILVALGLLVPASMGQSANTGAITGTAVDPSGAVLVGVGIAATNEATGDTRTTTVSSTGTFLFPLLPPGLYTVKASKTGFKELVQPHVRVTVTETARVNLRLDVGAVSEVVTVSTEAQLLDTIDSAEGTVTDGRAISALPLASRNYTQIIGLSPGVSSEVTDATALGRGTGSEAAADHGFSAHGSGTNDNNYQINGVEVNDLMGSGAVSGGVAVPNPDTIQEFKVQTGQYDASYGRNGGANVDLVTKGGSNQLHGSLFEFFRNDALNANDYFLNQQGAPRAVLKQNQFGGSLGGHIVRDRLFYFGSYQGTRQRNGLGGGSCISTVLLPPFTNDRSAAALGAMFSVPSGGAIAPDGANISPQALALLNLKLSNGDFVIPNPQTVTTVANPSLEDLSTEGRSSFSNACPFSENQLLVNVDYLQNAKSSLSGSFFFSNTSQVATMATNANIAGNGIPGFPQSIDNRYRVVSISHRYSISPSLVNQATLGYHRLVGGLGQAEVFKFSDIGVTAPAFDDSYPEIGVAGSFETGGGGQNLNVAQNFYNFGDSLFWNHTRHSLHVGGGIERSQINQVHFQFLGGLQFPDYEQFLLGNGSYSLDVPGLFDRYYRTWDGNVYAQDNIRITPRFTFNLGLRYERLGDLGDLLGRNSSFDPLRADHTGAGSVAGYVVASNFNGTALPPGVVRAPNEAATRGLAQNTWGPRVGFSWQLPGSDRVVLRGGYGIYYSRTTGQPVFQELTSPPFGQVRLTQGFTIPFSNPFPPAPVLPSFPSYSLATCTSVLDPGCVSFANVSINVKPPATQQYSLNTQIGLTPSLALEVGYQGARGTRLFELRNFNQALSASPDHPVNGATDNNFFNVTQRAPVPGVSTAALQVDSTGGSWYNGMAVSLNKRFSKGLQFLASYTWASLLATTQNFVSGSLDGGTVVGDQNNPRERYGWDQFVRPQRFILSWVYQFPDISGHTALVRKALGGWSLAGVTTVQSGQRLTVTGTNVQNVFGILTDRAPASATGCGSHFINSGTVQKKLNNYINPSCFDLSNYAVIGDDGIGTGFGNSGIGEVVGPDQNNWDISIAKNTNLSERVQLQFRTDFFNAFNHPQFANPNLDLGLSAPQLGLVSPDPTFGAITATSTNPRILQFALRLVF
jgi:Carboxypeptidase regulatory-like domain/TonB dependent receptor/TonB-dependent Receptor Plug Domain